MKRNCNGCRALDGTNCSLGYKTKAIYHNGNVFRVDTKPLEECPKPKTYDSYLKLISNN